MKKLVACLVVLLAVSCLTLTLSGNVSGQTEDVKILSYSYYYDNLGNIVVVGEIQNNGANIIDNVTVVGSLTVTDGDQATSGCLASATNILPGQKSSFYMEFNPQSIGQSTWYGYQISNIELAIYDAPPTDKYQYQDVLITSQTPAPQDGVYWVNCVLKNTGSQTATNVMVFGTYYNSTGGVVATGDIVNPIASLAPQATTTVKVPAFDLNQTLVPDSEKISSFRMLVQVEAPLLTGAAPVINPSATPVNTTPNPTSTPTEDSTLMYAAVVVVALVAVAAAVFLVRRKKPKETDQAAPTEAAKPKSSRQRNKK